MKEDLVKDEKIFNENEVCRWLKISRVTAWRLRAAGLLGYYRIGKKIAYGHNHVNEFLANCEEKGEPSA
ncbi:MAG: helix-turn-helix domain-containing protein [Acidobacteria bacterium]|nr:helix-turn-helix domain-containing protein [Acidobacteriota bacterium]